MRRKNLLKLLGAIVLAAVLTIVLVPGCAKVAPEGAAEEIVALGSKLAADAAPDAVIAHGDDDEEDEDGKKPWEKGQRGKKAEVIEETLPPSIIPVVFLSGSDYEMGYQYGHQLAAYIEAQSSIIWADTLQFRTYDEIIRELKARHYYYNKHAPEMIEQFMGIADGATDAGYPTTYEDVILKSIFVWSEPDWPYPSPIPPFPPHHCSNFTAWGTTTTDGRLIGGGTQDWCDTYFTAIVAFPDSGNNYITTADPPGLVGNFAINTEGLFMAEAGRGPSGYTYGLSLDKLMGYVARFADNAVEAKDMALSWGHTSFGDNENFGDNQGNHFFIEASDETMMVRLPGDYGETDFLTCSNDSLIPEMGAPTEPPSGPHHPLHSWWRTRGPAEYLKTYQGEVDLEFAKMMYRHYDPDGWALSNLSTAIVYIGIPPDEGDEGMVYLCTGPANRVTTSYSPTGGYYPIAPTHSFFQLVLKSSPDEVTVAAREEARACLRKADQELKVNLNHTDPEYAGLDQILQQAKTEWKLGFLFLADARLASGNEALFNYGKAATAYTRCQAFARQVYNALVPPPTTPADLGL